MKLFKISQKTTNSRHQHVQKFQKPQLLTSKETKIHSLSQVHHRHLHGSASAPSRQGCSHSRRRRRCRPATEMKPRHQRDSRRDNLKKETVLRDVSCEMTTRHTSLTVAIVVTPQLDGVALHAVRLIAKVTLPVDCDRVWDKKRKHNTTTRRGVHCRQCVAHCKRPQACDGLLVDAALADHQKATSSDVS